MLFGAKRQWIAALMVASIGMTFAVGVAHNHGFSSLNGETAALPATGVTEAGFPVCESCALSHSPLSLAISCVGIASSPTPATLDPESGSVFPSSLPRSLTARGPPGAF